MKPLIVLLITFGIASIILWLSGGNHFTLAGRIAMSAMLFFTAIGHFAFTKGMMLMLPQFVPFKKGAIYLTGILEVFAAIALLIPQLARATGWFLIVFFLLLLPANIYAAYRHIDYQKGSNTGPGIKYLWFRVPLQLLFIAWVYFVAIR